jgi:hypothetical protein
VVFPSGGAYDKSHVQAPGRGKPLFERDLNVHVALGATLAQPARLPTVNLAALVPETSVSSTESVSSPELVTVIVCELVSSTVTFPKFVVLATEMTPFLKVG